MVRRVWATADDDLTEGSPMSTIKKSVLVTMAFVVTGLGLAGPASAGTLTSAVGGDEVEPVAVVADLDVEKGGGGNSHRIGADDLAGVEPDVGLAGNDDAWFDFCFRKYGTDPEKTYDCLHWGMPID